MGRFSSKMYCALLSCAVVVTLSARGQMLNISLIRVADNPVVVNLGDSVFALSGDLNTELQADSGQNFRHHAISKTRTIRGISAPPTPSQYQTIKKDDFNISFKNVKTLRP